MTRKALIISNPGELGAENYCEGVKKDVANYKNFLMSAAGGGWDENEILCIERPEPFLLDIRLKLMENIDYTLIVFCGHGSATEDDTIIELKKGCDYKVESLRDGAKKRTIILDCCRVIEDELYAGEIENRYALFEKSSSDKMVARMHYDVALSKCPNGIVVTYACDLNETAGDDSRHGGYYSYSLLKCAKEFAKESSAEKCTSIVKVHDAASIMTQRRSGNTQHPQIEKPRIGPYFPFAVNV